LLWALAARGPGRWATTEPGKMGANYDGIQWDPPPEEKHVWWVACVAWVGASSGDPPS